MNNVLESAIQHCFAHQVLIDIEHTGNEKHPHECNITIYIKFSNTISVRTISAQEMKVSSFANLKRQLKRPAKLERPFAHKGETELMTELMNKVIN